MLATKIRLSIFVLTQLTISCFAPIVVADEDPFGLDGLETISDSEADEVRGLSSASNSFGVSFLSGVLFDPDTSSTARAHSLETTASIDRVDFFNTAKRSTLVNWERVVTLDFGLTINNFQAIMSGTIGSQGLASTPW